MLPYYIILMVLSLWTYMDMIFIPKRIKAYMLYFLACILIVFSAFRSENPDWWNYYWMYTDAIAGQFMVSPDIGFNFIIYVLSWICNSPILMFFFIATVSIGLNVNSFFKYTPCVFSCLLLYFVHNYVLKDMIQIRAGLASAICLYSIRYLCVDNKRLFLTTWIMATLIHFSAIIFGFVFFACKIKPEVKKICITILICIIIGTFFPLGQIIKKFAFYFSDERLIAYVAYGNSGFAKSLGIWTNLNAIKCLLISMFCTCCNKRLRDKFVFFEPIYYSYIIGLCWLLLFNDFAIIGARISNILLSVEPILMTMLISLFSKSSRPIYWVSLIGLAITMFQMNISPDKIVPYKFYLNSNIYQ